jgi:hypothetical protein
LMEKIMHEAVKVNGGRAPAVNPSLPRSIHERFIGLAKACGFGIMHIEIAWGELVAPPEARKDSCGCLSARGPQAEGRPENVPSAGANS